MTELPNCHEGPPRYYRLRSTMTPQGWSFVLGEPSDYQEVDEEERNRGPVIVEKGKKTDD